MISPRIAIVFTKVVIFLSFCSQESLMSSPVGVHRTLGGGEVGLDFDFGFNTPL